MGHSVGLGVAEILYLQRIESQTLRPQPVTLLTEVNILHIRKESKKSVYSVNLITRLITLRKVTNLQWSLSKHLPSNVLNTFKGFCHSQKQCWELFSISHFNTIIILLGMSSDYSNWDPSGNMKKSHRDKPSEYGTVWLVSTYFLLRNLFTDIFVLEGTMTWCKIHLANWRTGIFWQIQCHTHSKTRKQNV
jgi:hypothetical protein